MSGIEHTLFVLEQNSLPDLPGSYDGFFLRNGTSGGVPQLQ